MERSRKVRQLYYTDIRTEVVITVTMTHSTTMTNFVIPFYFHCNELCNLVPSKYVHVYNNKVNLTDRSVRHIFYVNCVKRLSDKLSGSYL